MTLAERVGVHQVTIARLETDVRRPSLKLLERLTRVLHVPVTALLGSDKAKERGGRRDDPPYDHQQTNLTTKGLARAPCLQGAAQESGL